MSSSYIAWFNGKFLTEDRIEISCNDRGFLYGDGLFETMRSIDHKVIGFRAHMERLRVSCQETRIPFDKPVADLRYVLGELLKKNQIADATVRLTVTRGIGDRFGFGFSDDLKPNWLMQVRPVKEIPESLYEQGVKISLQISPHFHPARKKPKVKSLSAMEYALAKQSALDDHSYDTVLMDTQENVYEGTSSNLFLFSDGRLVTPPLKAGILPGVTRARVLQIARSRLGLTVDERLPSKSELLGASEVFLTNTNVDILPVTRCGARKIGIGSAGLMTRQILETYRKTLVEILE
ncbi:MAG: aminotransferase class IV family protein [Bacteroidetes bacterium]|nr:aminotransferase class IV family protein [Bacteroidota bacterium]